MIVDGHAVTAARHTYPGKHLDHAEVARMMRAMGWPGTSAQWVRLVEGRTMDVPEDQATALAAVLRKPLSAFAPLPEGVTRLAVAWRQR
jgi:hypothetical protein